MSKHTDALNRKLRRMAQAELKQHEQLIQSAGTPKGPWTVHTDGCGQVWSPVGIVAEVWTGGEDDPRMEGGNTPSPRIPAQANAWGRMYANARLIASAPSLLEAAEALYEEVLAIIEDGTLGPEAIDHPAMKNVKAAITKAKGESE